jgi:hypothetical protein
MNRRRSASPDPTAPGQQAVSSERPSTSREPETVARHVAAEDGVDSAPRRFEPSLAPLATGNRLTYPMQDAAADSLLKKIVRAVGNQFSSVRAYILTPASLSLRSQTTSRLEEFRKVFPSLCGVRVYGVVNSKEFKEFASNLLRSIHDEPSTLFVIIQDEAHYGIKVESVLHKNLLEAIMSKGFHNVVHVAVSATPWVVLDKGCMRRRETHVVEYLPPPEYFGAKQLDKEGKWFADKKEWTEESLRDEYVCALKGLPVSDKFVKHAVASLKAEKADDLLVVRLPVVRGGPPAEERCENWKSALEQVVPAGVLVVNGAASSECDWHKLSEILKTSELAPTILILCNRYGIGDTFPSTFSFLDERLCLQSANIAENLVKVHQQLGRSYGYGRRPSVALAASTNAIVSLIPVTLDDVDNLSHTRSTPHKYLVQGVSREQNGELCFVPDPSCMYSQVHDNDDDDDAAKRYLDRRFVLCAQPQSGKTGVVLKAVAMLMEQITNPASTVAPACALRSTSLASTTSTQPAALFSPPPRARDSDTVEFLTQEILGAGRWCPRVESAFRRLKGQHGLTTAAMHAIADRTSFTPKTIQLWKHRIDVI